MKTLPIELPPPQLLEIAGADALTFAQAQFCNDVRALANGQWQWNAWLSPQGRVRAFFHLLRDDDEHLRLILRGGNAEVLRAGLSRFVFRAKAQLRTLPDFHATGIDDAALLATWLDSVPVANRFAANEYATALALPGSKSRWLLLRTGATTVDATNSPEALNRWRLEDIRAGLPELAAALTEQLLPQWLGLDRLGVVSVSKGCYPGQEIMARLHFKGSSKRSLYRLEFLADPPPLPGTSLHPVDAVTGESVGLVVMAASTAPDRGEALAMLADAAADSALRAASLGKIEVISRFNPSAP